MAVSYSALVLGLELVVDGNVQISPVALVWSAAERAGHVLAGLDGQDIGEVEDSLLPVRVLGVGSGAESHGLVAGGKLNVEPGDEGVDVVCPADLKAVREGEVEVVHGAFVEVEGENGRRVCHDGLEFDSVDKRLRQGGELQRSVVESVDVVPNWRESVKHV